MYCSLYLIQDSVASIIQQRLQITDNLILRLGLEKELKGHTGCVNCLEWNETGQYVSVTYFYFVTQLI